jgi:ATP-dependent RNA helicase RhlE
LTREGYATPTPVQRRCIPHVLAGRDLLGSAQTGTGKTAAFVLPILERLAARERGADGLVRALVLAPTRELAAQIGERTGAYGRNLGLTHAVIYGGVGQRAQEEALRRRPDVLIATPGRLLDLMQQGHVRLGGIEVLVLDEADRMLDMGFVHDVRRIVGKVPKERQTLLFSATMPRAIVDLSATILRDPVRVEVTPQATTAEKIEQIVYHVAKRDKRALLERVLRDTGVARTLVFTRTKHGANRLVAQLGRAGLRAAAIHGNKSQTARERALDDFKRGDNPILVATDIAARGIDVDGITHVMNYDLPDVPEQYVHRIGRTARAGAAGKAIAFCDEHESGLLADIERIIRQRIPVAEPSERISSGRRGDAAERKEHHVHDHRQQATEGASTRGAQAREERQERRAQAGKDEQVGCKQSRRRPRHRRRRPRSATAPGVVTGIGRRPFRG